LVTSDINLSKQAVALLLAKKQSHKKTKKTSLWSASYIGGQCDAAAFVDKHYHLLSIVGQSAANPLYATAAVD